MTAQAAAQPGPSSEAADAAGVRRYAISFTITPGAEPAVAEILRNYQRPKAGAAGGGAPLLRRTSVFLSGQQVVRVMDVAADPETVLRHLSEQPQIREVEARLDPYLATPRDLSTAGGMREFLERALLPVVFDRVTPEELRPATPAGERGQRCAIRYPVRPGCGAQLAELLTARASMALQADQSTTLAATTLFRRDDLLIRVFEVDGRVADALDHLARVVTDSPVGGELAELLDTTTDLTTVDGFRRFLADHQMELLTDRRVGRPVPGKDAP